MGLNLKSTSSKVLASAALLAAAAGVAGMGTYGGFTASTSASTAVNSATVKLSVGADGSTNRLSVAAAGTVPGDTMQRAVTLTNAGDQAFPSITFTTIATTSSILDTDAVNGLKLQIDACTVPWTEVGTAPSFTYSCSGTTTTVVQKRAVIGANTLTTLKSLLPGQTDNLRVSLTVPDTADNAFQGKNSTISFAFDAIQRSAGNK